MFELTDYYLLSHLRMEGKYFLKHIQDEIEKHEHVLFELDSGEELRYRDTRKFGKMLLVPKDKIEECKQIKELGLEPWDNNLTSEYLLDKYKLEVPKLYENIFLRPLKEIRLQGYIEQNMTVSKNGLAHIMITNQIINELGVDSGSAGNLVNNLNNISEVLVWVMISEDVKNGLYKFNIRSRGPIVNTIAERYNGGGHKFAAGARVTDKDLVDKLLKELDEICLDYKNMNNEV